MIFPVDVWEVKITHKDKNIWPRDTPYPPVEYLIEVVVLAEFASIPLTVIPYLDCIN